MKKEMTVGDLKKILELYPDHYLITYDSACGGFYTDEPYETTTEQGKPCICLND